MTERRLRGRLATVAIAVVACVASFALVGTVHPTDASWTTTTAMNTTVTAVTPAAVPTVSCGAASGGIGATVPIVWTAPSGPTPSRYRMHYTGTAGTGDQYSTSSPGALDMSGLSVAGTSAITVYPEYGNWLTSPVSLQTVHVTTIAVIVVVSWTCGP